MRITSYAPPTRNLAITILVLVVLFVLYVLAAGVWIVPGSLTAVSGLVDRLQPTCRAGQVVATYGCQSERTSSSCPSGTCYRVWVETAVGCNPSAASSSSSSSANGTTVTMALYTQCHFALGASIPHLLYDPRAEAELVEWYATNETARAWRRGDCTFTCKAFEASEKEPLVKNALLWAMDVTRNAPVPVSHTHTRPTGARNDNRRLHPGWLCSPHGPRHRRHAPHAARHGGTATRAARVPLHVQPYKGTCHDRCSSRWQPCTGCGESFVPCHSQKGV